MDDTAPASGPPRYWFLVGLLVLAMGVGVFIVSGSRGDATASDGSGASADPAPVVEFERVRPAERTFTITAPGRLEARQSLDVVGEVSGKIAYIHPELEIGGRIPEGEILFRIDQGDYRADLSRAEAQLATARATLVQASANRDRQVDLADIGAVPAAQKEAALASFATAEASVAEAEAQVTLAARNLAKTTVRAPFDALVGAESVSLDTFVSPGAPLARLIDAGAGQIRAGLSPADVRAVRRATAEAEGSPIVVRAVPNGASLGDLILEGTLASFAPSIDPASRTVAVRAIFPDAFAAENDGRTFVDDYLTLEIQARADTDIYELPTAALRQEQRAWMIAADDTLTEITVAPLETRGAYTLVTSTVDLSGQRVMTTPLAEETDGMAVRPTSDLAGDRG
ncbi:MAG: efflux RND transporter periplasmic adaptor subunit [Pseudomonadota bacterium]